MNQVLGSNSYVRAHDGVTAANDGCRPEFFMDAVPDNQASQAAGRPIFKDQAMVRIFMAGNHLNQPEFKVTQEWIDRFPEQYKRFAAGQEQVLEGTPIEQWPALTKAQVMELKSIGFRTVEELAHMSDSVCQQKIGMGGMSIREKAKAYVSDAEELAPFNKMMDENEKLKGEIAIQATQLEDLKGMVANLTAQIRQMDEQRRPVVDMPVGAPVPAAPTQVVSSLDSITVAPRRRGRPPKAA